MDYIYALTPKYVDTVRESCIFCRYIYIYIFFKFQLMDYCKMYCVPKAKVDREMQINIRVKGVWRLRPFLEK